MSQITCPEMPRLPALLTTSGHASILTEDGEVLQLPIREARAYLPQLSSPLVLHGPETFRRLDLDIPSPPYPWYDLLELFFFIYPTRSLAPTARALAEAIGITAPDVIEADFLPLLLHELTTHIHAMRDPNARRRMLAHLPLLKAAGWKWSDHIAYALRETSLTMNPRADSLQIFSRIPAWRENALRPAPSEKPLKPDDVARKLENCLGPHAEHRPAQVAYAKFASQIFATHDRSDPPIVVLAEAGTGTGKTIGYLTSAMLWARANQGTVWISTYTRHLQRQIAHELERIYPDPEDRQERVVVRKGRENYLCLLNYQEAINRLATRGAQNDAGEAIALVMIARWCERTKEGDLYGGDLPGWYGDLFGNSRLTGLADQRGECIHGACIHYSRCFVEKITRRARQADLVIVNHALAMASIAWGQQGSADETPLEMLPTRVIFDESHQLPEASDTAFAHVLSGAEAEELRRWLIGKEINRSRARGLRQRLDDLIELEPKLEPHILAIIRAAQVLPSTGWSERLQSSLESSPSDIPTEPERTSVEAFLGALIKHLISRVGDEKAAKGSECDVWPISDPLREHAAKALNALTTLYKTLSKLNACLIALSQSESIARDTLKCERVQYAAAALRRRALARVTAWCAMLNDLITRDVASGADNEYIDFVKLDPLRRRNNRVGLLDIALCRHWLDPMQPFAASLRGPSHGLLFTSATLRDASTETDDTAESDAGWERAKNRLGTAYFDTAPLYQSLASPFDYDRQTRIYVITDVARDSVRALANAYLKLFLASGGGGLGLFTAIARLKAVHAAIARPLDAAGLMVYAQHVDSMQNVSLVDAFRSERHSCLLGTDAMRDGINVPGNALRLLVYERTPWPRPAILHRERRARLGDKKRSNYDDSFARMRLRQAFGRLIRQRDDRGVFVLLDRQIPTRLLSAFPKNVAICRRTLEETVAEISLFFQSFST